MHDGQVIRLKFRARTTIFTDPFALSFSHFDNHILVVELLKIIKNLLNTSATPNDATVVVKM